MERAIRRNGVPVAGFGLGTAPAVADVAATASPWRVALVTSAVGVATGWVMDEIARRTFRKDRRRR